MKEGSWVGLEEDGNKENKGMERKERKKMSCK